MNYFVTGATGFIGRYLVQRLLQREGTVHVLVRAGCGRLEEMRTAWAPQGAGRAVAGDLRSPVSGSPSRTCGPARRGRPLLSPGRDLRHDRRRRGAAGRQHRGHPTCGRIRRRDPGRLFHQVSSIAAAGLYQGVLREDMFDEAEKLDTHPYIRTKHESERVVREECSRPWRVYRPASSSATPARVR